MANHVDFVQRLTLLIDYAAQNRLEVAAAALTAAIEVIVPTLPGANPPHQADDAAANNVIQLSDWLNCFPSRLPR